MLAGCAHPEATWDVFASAGAFLGEATAGRAELQAGSEAVKALTAFVSGGLDVDGSGYVVLPETHANVGTPAEINLNMFSNVYKAV